MEDSDFWMKVLREVGPWALLVGLHVWWSWVRECRMAKRMDTLEDYIRSNMQRALDRNTEALRENAKQSGEVVRCLAERVCLMEHEKGSKKYSNLPKGQPYEQKYRVGSEDESSVNP